MKAINLLMLRKKNNLSQQDLGEKLGLSKNAISHYEKGDREPDLRTLCKMADIFEVSVDYLLGRVDEKEIKVIKEEIPLSDDESMLLNSFRKCSADGKTYLLGQALTVSVVGPPVVQAQNTATEEAATREEGKLLA